MKPAVLVPLAFALGLAGSTGAVAMTHRAPPPATVLPPADSTTKVATAGDSVVTDSAKADTTKPAAPVDTAVVAVVDTVPAAETPPAAPSTKQAAASLAKLAVDDAAALVALLSDDDAARLFGALGVKRSAPILARLPRDRAARISRRLLTQSDQGGKP